MTTKLTPEQTGAWWDHQINKYQGLGDEPWKVQGAVRTGLMHRMPWYSHEPEWKRYQREIAGARPDIVEHPEAVVPSRLGLALLLLLLWSLAATTAGEWLRGRIDIIPTMLVVAGAALAMVSLGVVVGRKTGSSVLGLLCGGLLGVLVGAPLRSWTEYQATANTWLGISMLFAFILCIGFVPLMEEDAERNTQDESP
jgi:hypothetical protein